MPDWAAFAGFTGVVLALLLLLARASQAAIGGSHDAVETAASGTDDDAEPDDDAERRATGGYSDGHESDSGTESSVEATRSGIERTDGIERSGRDDTAGPTSVDSPRAESTQDDPTTATAVDGTGFSGANGDVEDLLSGSGVPDHWADRMHATQPSLSTAALLANVAISQGAFWFLLLIGAWVAEIPAAAFGVTSASVTLPALGVGVVLGTGLYVANEVGASVSDRMGLGRSEELRSLLAPDSAAGWVLLLLVILPLIAGFEEFLFRATLVGALSMGFGVSPWLLAVLSSVAFALGHGAQGPAGVVVTGVLGFVLAAAFVFTESFLVVFVAHYLVNALEFVVHEGLGVEWL